MNPASLTLSLSLFAFWLILGWGVLVILRAPLERLASLLVAPTVGFSVTLIPTFWLNLVGMPVSSFSRGLTALLILLALVGWLIRRPAWTRNHILVLTPIIVTAIFVGFPTLIFGFDWIANANDDWSNYNLSAMRLLSKGMLDKPNIDDLLAGVDYPGYYYFATVAKDNRPGSDLTLAWLSGVTGLNPFMIFMPLIIAFNAMLTCSAAALALIGRRSRLQWALGVGLTALAPLSFFAVRQQLIAQVIGLALTTALTALSCVTFRRLTDYRYMTLVAVVATAYLVTYPELFPFYGLAVVCYHTAHARDREWGWSWVSSLRLLTIPMQVIVMTGPYIVGVYIFLISQSAGSSTQGRIGEISIFPYFLVPSGLSTLWGFMGLADGFKEPYLSISISIALVLTVFTLLSCIIDIRRGGVVSGMILIFSLATFQIIRQGNDFGLFKIAMFVQPFIWFAITGSINRKSILILTSCFLALLTINTDRKALVASLVDSVGGENGIGGASRDGLLHDILSKRDVSWCSTDFETSLMPLAKIISATPGCSRFFPSRFVFGAYRGTRYVGIDPVHRLGGIDEYVSKTIPRIFEKSASIKFHYNDGRELKINAFDAADDSPRVGLYSKNENVLNENQAEQPNVVDKTSLENHLTFISSDIGDFFYLPFFPVISLYSMEKDPFFQNSNFQAIGRYLLFKVTSKASTVRMILDLSLTAISGTNRLLPSSVIVGESSVKIGFSGYGTARLASPAVSPLNVDGRRYVLLDLGRDPQGLNVPRTGAMNLYGTKVALDYRSVVAFARRIKIISADDCDCLAAPSRLTNINQDLQNPSLRYSGIYEDGWIGSDGFAYLDGRASGVAVFKAMIPGGVGLNSLSVSLSVDDSVSISKNVTPGEVSLQTPVSSGLHRISWHFSSGVELPNGDGRGASAKLQSLSIVPEGSALPSFDP